MEIYRIYVNAYWSVGKGDIGGTRKVYLTDFYNSKDKVEAVYKQQFANLPPKTIEKMIRKITENSSLYYDEYVCGKIEIETCNLI